MSTLRVRLTKEEEADGYITSGFDVLDDGKKVASFAMAITAPDASGPFEVAYTLGTPDSQKKLGFNNVEEHHLYGPIAAAFLQTVYRLMSRHLGGTALNSAGAAFLAVQEATSDDE